ncbi:Dyp-type peroxidase [Streptomyces massasporeus]
MPSTPGGLFLHIMAARTDLCFALAAELLRRLRGAVTVRDGTQAFSYFDSRNLLGFVDGTENPVGQAAADAALVGEEDPAFRGGSYALVQKYLHDVDAWDALAVEAQEKVIGRTELTNPGHGEFGTYFVAYARTPGIPETMLRKMFLGGPGAGPDPLLDYSRAVTGSLFFVPPSGFLEDLPDS